MPLIRVPITHVPVERRIVDQTADLLRELADEVERRCYTPVKDGAIDSPGCVGCGLGPGKGHQTGCRIGELLRRARDRQQDFEGLELKMGL